MAELLAELVTALCDVIRFAEVCSGITLRSYQVDGARSSIRCWAQGLTFVVIFQPGGKKTAGTDRDARCACTGGRTLIAGPHLEAAVAKRHAPPGAGEARCNLATPPVERIGLYLCIGQARIFLRRRSPTWSGNRILLLECIEAQTQIAKWDKESNDGSQQ
jgi:hypothetical protein